MVEDPHRVEKINEQIVEGSTHILLYNSAHSLTMPHNVCNGGGGLELSKLSEEVRMITNVCHGGNICTPIVNSGGNQIDKNTHA